MKLHLPKVLLASVMCTAAWAATTTYDVEDMAVTNLDGDRWSVRIAVNIDIENVQDEMLSIVAMGTQTHLTEIDNNFEILYNTGTCSFTLNHCTANGKGAGTWNIDGTITESGVYSIYLQGNSFGDMGFDGKGVTEFYVLKGNNLDVAVNEKNKVFGDLAWDANFTFEKGTIIDTLSSDADVVEIISFGVAPSAPSVPEPTTATLSLLALAALAARRRRR